VIAYLDLQQVLDLHDASILLFGGSPGVRDLGLVQSAVAQPRQSFGGVDLYPTLVEKAGALGYSLVRNHGFVDGNKRTGFAALEVFLRANGSRVIASVADAEAAVLAVASGQMSRDQFTAWVAANIAPLSVP
jgi:death-on-curing protein